MKYFNEINLDLTDQELITEISVGKISKTVIIGKIFMLSRKTDEKITSVLQMLKWIGILIFVVSITKSKKSKTTNTKNTQQELDSKKKRRSDYKKKIIWKHLQDR